MNTVKFTTDELQHLHNAMAGMLREYCQRLSTAAYMIDMGDDAYLAQDIPEIARLTQLISDLLSQSHTNDKGDSDDNS